MPKAGRRNDSDKLNYLFGSKAVTSNAPFGTHDTPDLKMRIVGGKPALVAEGGAEKRSGEVKEQTSTVPRLNLKASENPPKLGAITEKPNNFDPTPFVTNKKGLAGFVSAQQDTHRSHVHSPVSEIIPEEKARQNFPTSNRGPVKTAPLHPKNENKFTKANEAELILRLKEELSGFDTKKLKDVYLELTGFDNNLTGKVNYDQLGFALLRSQVTIAPRTIQLLSSKFKSPGEEEMVNYEQLLSFIGNTLAMPLSNSQNRASTSPRAAESLPNRNEEGNTNKPTYYFNPVSHEMEDYSPRSKKFPYQDRNNAKLLRYIEQQLMASEHELDFERIWAVFRQADRGRRGRLSGDQIKDLTYQCRIPLQESIVEQIIQRCESSNGQYNWQEYLEFIERVAPLHTGLKIPESKQPAEYARQYPTPSTDWPKRGERPYREPVRKVKEPEQKLSDMDKDLDELLILQKQKALKEEIDRLEDQLQKTPRKTTEPSEPWFDRFMRLASALYDADKGDTGHLSRDEVAWLVKKNNTELHLHLKQADLDEALRSAADADGRLVDLDLLLKVLGVKGQ